MRGAILPRAIVPAALLIAAACVPSVASSADRLARFTDVRLGDPQRRFDYQSLDATTGRLYVAEMSAGRVLVFDTRSERVVAEVPGVASATGVLAVPEVERVYVSAPGGPDGGEVVAIATRALAVVARIPAGRFPDGLAYDPGTRRLFVSDERGGALLAIDTTRDAAVGRIDLGGEVGNVRVDIRHSRVIAAVQSRNELAIVDPRRLRVVARVPLPGCEHPHGLLLDPRAAVAFVACDGNDRLYAVDVDAGRVLHDIPVAKDPDVLALDPGWSRLYVAGEGGELSIVDVARAERPELLQTTRIAAGAHSVCVEPSTHRVYVPLPNVGGAAVLRIFDPGR
jgi:DNA-binding beta-propeller fold protein YncE